MWYNMSVTIYRNKGGKVECVELVVNGEPVAQGRPRFSTRGGFVKAYDPKKSRDYKNLIRTMAQEVYVVAPDFKPFEGSLVVLINVYRQIPKSFSKKKKEAAIAGLVRPVSRPDSTNYVKGVEDSISGVLWKDDSQIVDLTCCKFYSIQPRVEVTIWNRVLYDLKTENTL